MKAKVNNLVGGGAAAAAPSEEEKPTENPPQYGGAAAGGRSPSPSPGPPPPSTGLSPSPSAVGTDGEEEGVGVSGFLRRHLAKGVQLVPKIKMTKQTDDKGKQLRDLKSADFNIPKYEEGGCLNNLFFILNAVGLFAYFATILSDIYSLYALHVNPAIPVLIFYIYLGVFLVSLLFVFVETSVASKRLNMDDFSAIILDELASQMFSLRSLAHFCLVDKIKAKFGITDRIVLKLMYGLQNGRRLLIVTIPQTVLSAIALYFKSQGKDDISLAISVLPYVLKFASLFNQFTVLINMLIFYPLVRCCIRVRQKDDMSLWDYMNLMTEKILNKFIDDPKFGGGEKQDAINVAIGAAIDVAV
eukprot:TRINITY_DN3971_c0_g3_i1.p1 TRINITY_DN3971_c0_g3~~TRINITY_DN3971_c0_g3_i1.p1  ORF type:complete len:385 (-),score=127.01 TRINITY_DN3971_c0_g3_i1:936-2009(-)